MGRGQKSERSPQVVELQQRMAEWRKTRSTRGRVPAELWQSATAAAQVHGVHHVHRALRVNYGALKKRVAAADALEVGEGREKFIELRPATLLGAETARCVVELQAPDGSSLTIRVMDQGMLNVGKLAGTFLRRRR